MGRYELIYWGECAAEFGRLLGSFIRSEGVHTLPNKIQILNPPGLGPAQGLYSQLTYVPPATATYHIAGQLSVGKDGAVVGMEDFATQFHQVYANLGDVLSAVREGYDSIITMNTYLTDENLVPEFMKLRTVLFAKIFAGPNYPPNTLLIVNRLVKSEFLIEVQAVAAKTS